MMMMRTVLRSALIAFALLAVAGCKSSSSSGAGLSWKELSIPDSKVAHAAGAAFFDANTEDFRKKNGKVPGATLLASSSRYDVAATLPADKNKQLVFYCSSRT